MAEDHLGPAALPELLHLRSAHCGLHQQSRTYLALIACVLQDSPGKKLTFIQVMRRPGDPPPPQAGLCLASPKRWLYLKMVRSKNAEGILCSLSSVGAVDGKAGRIRHGRQEVFREQHPSLLVLQQMLCQGEHSGRCVSLVDTCRTAFTPHRRVSPPGQPSSQASFCCAFRFRCSSRWRAVS